MTNSRTPSDAPGPGSLPLTQMLADARDRKPGALDDLIAKIYDELRKLAAAKLASERPGHTLQPTALVNEAAVRLLATEKPSWESRAHLFGAAAEAMRRVLVDHARARNAAKRGGGHAAQQLGSFAEEVEATAAAPDAEVMDVDRLLHELAALDPRQAQIVTCRYFGGMNDEQIGAVMGMSASNVGLQWKFAKAWLRKRLE